ncbi:MAG: 3-deoxy-7-phosphoheptulonate synthase [Acidobacteriota bacterium]|nr:3-deoxy-7-phosphoheptulonate synthase [Acidobacteriota bacterium]MDH3784068.1 3-deoxy-7-phosphoheptulonate synthase [Acidobacteriota bacterium]
MLIVMKSDSSTEQVERVCSFVKELGLTPHPIPGKLRTAIGITGNKGPVEAQRISALPGVAELIRVTSPYKLAGREMKPDNSIVDVDGVQFGGKEFVIIAGPCSVETPEQTMETARCVKGSGAHILRGGAFKPRTSPYSFQGLGERGLDILLEAKAATGLPIVSEVVDTETFDLVESKVDMFQIGSRNMQNYSLLKRAGRSRKPVLLKRWMSGTMQEFLMCAEYIMSEGNHNVILCERGVRAFSDFSRFTLDIAVVPELKQRSHLPVIVDPSHAGGKRDLVIPLARTAVAAGADGIIVEVHPHPEEALSDGPQALTPDMFEQLVDEIQRLAPAVGRSVRTVV